MSKELNARSTTYRVAHDVIYDPREGDVFGMGDYWEYVVLGRVVVDGFDCVRFCSVVGETRTEWTVNLNEWIDRCVGEEIERQMPHHVRGRKVLHVAQFPKRVSEASHDEIALCVRRILVSQDNPERERERRIKEDIMNMMFWYNCISNPGLVLSLASQGSCFKRGIDESLVQGWIDEVVRKNEELNG